MGLVELMIKLLETRGKNRRDLFSDFVKPLWDETEKIHTSYIQNFRKYHASLTESGLTRDVLHGIALNLDEFRSSRERIGSYIQALQTTYGDKVDGIDASIENLSWAINEYLNMDTFVRKAKFGEKLPECLIDERLKRYVGSFAPYEVEQVFKKDVELFKNLTEPVKLRDGAVILRMNPYWIALQQNLLSKETDDEAAIELIDLILAHLQDKYAAILSSFQELKLLLLR